MKLLRIVDCEKKSEEVLSNRMDHLFWQREGRKAIFAEAIGFVLIFAIEERILFFKKHQF